MQKLCIYSHIGCPECCIKLENTMKNRINLRTKDRPNSYLKRLWLIYKIRSTLLIVHREAEFMLAHVYSCTAASGYQYTMTRRPMKGCLVLRGKLLYTVSTCKNQIHHLLNTSTTQSQTQHPPLPPSPPSWGPFAWLCCALLLLNQKQMYHILQAPPSLADRTHQDHTKV